MSHQTELQGFLSIKIPPKIRGFLPWKTWKRQWISIRSLPSGGVELSVGRNSQNVLHIALSDIIVRTHSRSHLYAFGIYPRQGATANFCLAGTSESESQKWMSTIRKLLRPPLLPVEDNEFLVSVIDNSFTRSSGFPGLYGILRITTTGLTITDQFTSNIKSHWLWHQMSHMSIASTFSPEDKDRICTIITTREFPTGSGKINLFCLEAGNLIWHLTKGRSSTFVKLNTPCLSNRHHTISHDYRKISNTPMLNSKIRSLSESASVERRLSKSEGNLLSLLDHLDNSSECSDSGFMHDVYNSVFSSPDLEKISTQPDPQLPSGKTGPRFSSSCDAVTSQYAKVNPTHMYQELENEINYKEMSSTSYKTRLHKLSLRRESGFSVASGVYEEIDELFTSLNCSFNVPDENSLDSPPPPLPPRRGSFNKRSSNKYGQNSTLRLPDFTHKFISRSAGNTPLPSPPSLSRTTSTEFSSKSLRNEEDSHYLPMNPCSNYLKTYHKCDHFTSEPNEEQMYVVMASFKKDQT